MIKHNIYNISKRSISGKITQDGFAVRSKLINIINNNNNNNNNNHKNNNNNNNKSNNKNNNNFIPTFNILVATIGRETLENLIESLSNELSENDCLTIVFDNNTQRDIKNIEKIKSKIVIYNENKKLGFWGHGIRNKYSSILDKRDFILHADDDDSYFPNCFGKLRKECVNTNTLYIAKMMRVDKVIIPNNNFNITIGNIGTPCGIIPYNFNLQGKWGYFYGGDGQFYIDLIKIFGKVFILNTLIYNCGNKSNNLEYYNRIYNR